MLTPDQFRVNEAWIAVRINEAFLLVNTFIRLFPNMLIYIINIPISFGGFSVKNSANPCY